ncbi:MAG: hypothetical protein FJX75_29220 [Armatimonadetes bacterium]|nr:hypothetical protein [Armatimonadota bacterium]
MKRLVCRRVQRALSRMVDGRLTGDQAEGVRAHLAVCEQCEREHAGLLRLRAALADQPRVEMRADALERLQTRLAARGRPSAAPQIALAAFGLVALVGLAAGLPRLVRPARERETTMLAAAPGRPDAVTAEHRQSEAIVPGAVEGARVVGTRRAEKPAANRGQSSLRPARAGRKGTVPRRVGGEAPSPKTGAGSTIIIVVTPQEASCEAGVALRMASIEGADGRPEAMVTMIETRGRDGSVQYVDYEYHPVEPEGTATGSASEPGEEGMRDGDDTQDDPQTGTGGPGAEFAAGLVECGAEAV